MLRNVQVMFKTQILLLAFVIFKPQMLTSFPYLKTFIIWNVGQGQWTTWINLKGECFHFDLGGEITPLKAVLRACRKENFFILTHLDSDHRRFLKVFQRKAQAAPLGEVHKLENNFFLWKPQDGKNENQRSSWILIDHKILITGDSPRSVEKLFVQNNSNKLRNVQLFVLGHHGSQTSNGPELLSSLPKLQTTVASARWARFYHPHWKVTAALQKRKTPLLQTEKWGHLIFQF